ncbi:transmembrane protein 80-like isoform X2 [Triplophysa dalaica]|uniref:transmembrane protein 80-like isoform X2 n=1 Tax=Triplophysa dalaica TaxID=1582913 RepID=UPI0024E022E2|nr:transmembrane protein 80-like isoform X2 [Triplophysa dalaica]
MSPGVSMPVIFSFRGEISQRRTVLGFAKRALFTHERVRLTRSGEGSKMATGMAGRNTVVISSVLLQILLYLSAGYSVLYFLSTLSMIIYKTEVLSYPDGQLTLDVCLLFLMAGLEVLRVYWGIRGNLQESEGYLGLNLIATGATVLLALYYIIWQSYVLRADVIIGAILLCLYGLTGIVGFGALARFTSYS